MKNTKSLLKIMVALMSLALVIGALLVLGAASVGATSVDETEEQERETIPVPEIPAIDRPYKTIEELGIDFESIDAYFPREIEVKHENGKVYVEDFGARSVEAFDYDSMANVSFELTDGYWTAELASVPTVIHTYAYETSISDKCVCASYYGNGKRDSYVVLNDFANSRHVSFAVDYGTVTVSYQTGDCYYEDRYEEGVLNTHGVSNREDPESINDVLFGVDGKIRYCILYINGYYYYFPGQGWSSNWEYFVACDAPEGYEDKDENSFAANKISLICTEAKGDDIVHDMSDVSCIAPATCKNCGYTEGEVDQNAHRSDGGENCADCGEHAFVTINGETYTILGDITNTGISFNHNESPAPGAWKAGDGYLVFIVKDSYYADVILYNATIDVRETEGVVAVDLIKDHLDYYVYGTNNIYGNERRAFHNGTVGEDTITNFIIDEDAVLNIYGNSDFDHLVVTSGEMNVYGRDVSGDVSMAMQVIKSLTVKEGATLTAVGGKSDMGITVGVWVRKETVVDGVLNAFTVNREETEEKAILTFIVNGDVVLNCDNFNVYADYPGYEIILSVPEGASLTVPEGLKLDLDSYTGVEIEGELIVNGTLICTHNGGEANCTSLAVCDKCKQGYGELAPDDHDMADATCILPSTCKNGCGHTEGEALGHDWIDATYDAPKTCSVCGETEGEPLQKETESETETDKKGTDTPEGGKETENGDSSGGSSSENNENESGGGGCGSSIGIGVVAMVTILGAAVIFKKKK